MESSAILIEDAPRGSTGGLHFFADGANDCKITERGEA